MATTFDPELAGATADFTDGVTTVPANFLDSLPLRFKNPREAMVAYRNLNGAVGVLADPNVTVAPLEVIDEVAVAEFGSNLSSLWDVNSEFLFKRTAATVVSAFALYAAPGAAGAPDVFEQFVPPVEYTVSWAGETSPTIQLVYASDLYLVVGGTHDSTTYKIDIFDLAAGALIGTYAVVDAFVGSFDHNQHVMGRTHFFVQTDTSTASLYAIDLSTATLDASWGTAGVLTLNYGVANLALDDLKIYAVTDDDVEVIDQATGVQLDTSAGIGTGTNNAGVCTDGKGNFFVVQTTGANYLGKYKTNDDGDVVQVAEQLLGTNAPVSMPVCCGRWVYVAQAAAGPLLAYDADTLLLWGSGPAAPAATAFTDNAIRFDGLNIVGEIQAADSWNVDGFVRIKAIEPYRHFARIAAESYGRGPFKGGIVPIDF